MQLLCPTTEGFDSPTTCWMSDKNPLKGAGQRFYNTDDPQRFSNTNDPLTSQHTEADSTCSALKYESVSIQNKLMISIQCVQRTLSRSKKNLITLFLGRTTLHSK